MNKKANFLIKLQQFINFIKGTCMH